MSHTPRRCTSRGCGTPFRCRSPAPARQAPRARCRWPLPVRARRASRCTASSRFEKAHAAARRGLEQRPGQRRACRCEVGGDHRDRQAFRLDRVDGPWQISAARSGRTWPRGLTVRSTPPNPAFLVARASAPQSSSGRRFEKDRTCGPHRPRRGWPARRDGGSSPPSASSLDVSWPSALFGATAPRPGPRNWPVCIRPPRMVNNPGNPAPTARWPPGRTDARWLRCRRCRDARGDARRMDRRRPGTRQVLHGRNRPNSAPPPP